MNEAGLRSVQIQSRLFFMFRCLLHRGNTLLLTLIPVCVSHMKHSGLHVCMNGDVLITLGWVKMWWTDSIVTLSVRPVSGLTSNCRSECLTLEIMNQTDRRKDSCVYPAETGSDPDKLSVVFPVSATDANWVKLRALFRGKTHTDRLFCSDLMGSTNINKSSYQWDLESSQQPCL